MNVQALTMIYTYIYFQLFVYAVYTQMPVCKHVHRNEVFPCSSVFPEIFQQKTMQLHLLRTRVSQQLLQMCFFGWDIRLRPFKNKILKGGWWFPLSSLMFPKVPQSAQTESLNTPPVRTLQFTANATNSKVWICCTPLRVTTPLPSWSLPGFFGKREAVASWHDIPFLVKHFGHFFKEVWNASETPRKLISPYYITKCPRQVYQMLEKIWTSIKWWLYSHTKKCLT